MHQVRHGQLSSLHQISLPSMHCLCLLGSKPQNYPLINVSTGAAHYAVAHLLLISDTGLQNWRDAHSHLNPAKEKGKRREGGRRKGGEVRRREKREA